MNIKTLAYLALAALGAFLLPSCETTTSASGSGSEWRRPPRYGTGSSTNGRSSSSSNRNSRGSNRFGYSGNDNSRPSASSSDSSSNKRISASEEKPKKKEEKKKASSSGSDKNLKYAVKVPGRPLEVKLPGVSQPISIEKYDSAGKPTGEALPPGTAVEIPDPNGSGKKIQFLVP